MRTTQKSWSSNIRHISIVIHNSIAVSIFAIIPVIAQRCQIPSNFPYNHHQSQLNSCKNAASPFIALATMSVSIADKRAPNSKWVELHGRKILQFPVSKRDIREERSHRSAVLTPSTGVGAARWNVPAIRLNRSTPKKQRKKCSVT